jgi:peptidoglycan/xylan/chitin deacetylase (PgdA/CDA1 family)
VRTHSLLLAGARANLVFHDVSEARSRYAVTPTAVLEIAEQLRGSGLSRHVRFYFDDGLASALPTAKLLRERNPEIEVVVALTIDMIGSAGYLSLGEALEMRKSGVEVAGHGCQHVRLASYRDRMPLPTPSEGEYAAAPSTAEPHLSANQVLYQLVETRDRLHGIARSEFVLPYGAYNRDVLSINARHRIFETLSSSDYGWDRGAELRPRLLVTRDLAAAEIPRLLASPWPTWAPR